LACGAEPLLPKVPGVKMPHVISAESVLLDQTLPQGRVAVIGSGMTGLETAELLALKGCTVTLVEMLDALGGGVYPTVLSDIMGRILPLGTQVLLEHRLTAIDEKKVNLLRLTDGQHVSLTADWVVLAVGVRPRRALAEACGKRFKNLYVIGDASRPGRIMEAMQDAQAKAFVFETDPV